MRIFCCLAIFVVLACGGAIGSYQSSGMNLVLEIGKTRFRSGEPIKVRILLENQTGGEKVVNRRLLVNIPAGPHEVFFQITGPDGKQLPFERRIRDSFESREFLELRADEILGLSYELNNSYSLNQLGEYTIVAFYENQQDAPAELKLAPAWKGRVKSNSIKFVVE